MQSPQPVPPSPQDQHISTLELQLQQIAQNMDLATNVAKPRDATIVPTDGLRGVSLQWEKANYAPRRGTKRCGWRYMTAPKIPSNHIET
jgi:hypothetical protein